MKEAGVDREQAKALLRDVSKQVEELEPQARQLAHQLQEQMATFEKVRADLNRLIQLRDALTAFTDESDLPAARTAEGERRRLREMRLLDERSLVRRATQYADSRMERRPEVQSQEVPPTSKAIETVLKEVAPAALAPREVVAELERRGWLPEKSSDPARLIGSTLHRLANRRTSDVERVELGQYRYGHADPPPEVEGGSTKQQPSPSTSGPGR